MQFLFKVIILFLIVFNFRMPVFYNSALLSLFLCAAYYIIKRGSIPFTYFFQRYNVVILIGTIILAFVVFAIAMLHHTDIMSIREKRIWLIFLVLCSTIFAIPLLIEGKESNAFKELAVIILYAFALQGFIGFTGYLYSPFGNFLYNMKPEGSQELLLKEQFEKFRLLNLSGPVFVELTAAFGFVFIVFFWIQLLKSGHTQLNGWKQYFILFFIFLGNLFAGRTGFIGLILGIGGWLLFSYNRVFTFFRKNIVYAIGFFFIVLFIYNVLLSNKQRQSFNAEVFPFAFEWYYKYEESGRAEVASMEVIPSHYYYMHDETLWKGTGVDPYKEGSSIYAHSDAGYTNTLIYGGIPLLICLIIYQSLYFIRPISIALKNNTRNNRINIGFFLLLFLYLSIVEIKAPALGSLYIAEAMYLFLGTGYMIQHNLQKEHSELIG